MEVIPLCDIEVYINIYLRLYTTFFLIITTFI